MFSKFQIYVKYKEVNEKWTKNERKMKNVNRSKSSKKLL